MRSRFTTALRHRSAQTVPNSRQMSGRFFRTSRVVMTPSKVPGLLLLLPEKGKLPPL